MVVQQGQHPAGCRKACVVLQVVRCHAVAVMCKKAGLLLQNVRGLQQRRQNFTQLTPPFRSLCNCKQQCIKPNCPKEERAEVRP